MVSTHILKGLIKILKGKVKGRKDNRKLMALSTSLGRNKINSTDKKSIIKYLLTASFLSNVFVSFLDFLTMYKGLCVGFCLIVFHVFTYVFYSSISEFSNFKCSTDGLKKDLFIYREEER